MFAAYIFCFIIQKLIAALVAYIYCAQTHTYKNLTCHTKVDICINFHNNELINQLMTSVKIESPLFFFLLIHFVKVNSYEH